MIDNDMLGFFVTYQHLDDIVDELALAGYPECNSNWVQERAARNLGYRDAEDMYKLLSRSDIEYIKNELTRRLR